MRLIVNAERVYTRVITVTAVAFFVGGTFLYGVQILSRLLFQDSFFWIDALISYLFTLAALMGAALAVRSRENIKIDILRKYAQRPTVRLLIDSFSALITVVLIIIFYYHTDVLFESGSLSVYGIPDWVLNLPYLLLFIGSLLYYLIHIGSSWGERNPNKTSS